MAVNAAIALERPLLVKGEPGTGKTVLAHEVAKALGAPLIEWHIKSTTKAQQGLYEYDAVTRLRDASSATRACTTSRNYIKRGKLWEAFDRRRAAGAADRRDRQGRHRVPQRPAARARSHGVLRLRDAARRSRPSSRPIVIITSNNEKELPDAFLRRCFFHYIRFPDRETMKRIVDVHFPGIKTQAGARGAEHLLRHARGAGPEEEAVDLGAARLAEAADGRGHPARGAAQRKDPQELIPPLHGALLKNEQDVHLFERLAFLARREQRKLKRGGADVHPLLPRAARGQACRSRSPST